MPFVFDSIQIYLLEIAEFPRLSGLRAVRVPAMGLGIRSSIETGIAAQMITKEEKTRALPGTHGAGGDPRTGSEPGAPIAKRGSGPERLTPNST